MQFRRDRSTLFSASTRCANLSCAVYRFKASPPLRIRRFILVQLRTSTLKNWCSYLWLQGLNTNGEESYSTDRGARNVRAQIFGRRGGSEGLIHAVKWSKSSNRDARNVARYPIGSSDVRCLRLLLSSSARIHFYPVFGRRVGWKRHPEDGNATQSRRRTKGTHLVRRPGCQRQNACKDISVKP